MTRREAFLTVLGHKEVRPVPFTVKFTVEARENYARHLGREFDPVADTGSYVVASHTNNGWTEVSPGHFRDYFGVVWNKTVDRTLGVVDDPPLKGPSLDGYTFPDPESAPVYGFIRQNQKRYPDRFHTLSIGFALFERAWSLTGMENLLLYLMVEPAFVHDLLDRIAAYNVALIRAAAQLGIDCVHFGDDWGSQQGLLMSPETWRAFIKPRYAAMCAAAGECGLLVSQHSCGNVVDLLPDMVEAGVDVFDPFQPEAMDIWQVRERYRGTLAFWGGLSVQSTLPHGSPRQVRDETRRLLSEMAPGGGYILSPSHSLTGDIPMENIEAFLEVAQNQ